MASSSNPRTEDPEAILDAVIPGLEQAGAKACAEARLSTMSGEIFSVLKKCHVPKLIIELMNMMYRFIFILLDTNSKMRNSAESRLGYTDFRKALYSFGSTASNLFVVSMKRGNQFFDAL